MKKRITELAEESLNFQIDVSLFSLYLLKYIGWLSPYYSFLYLVSKEFKPRMIVEIGTFWGTSAIYLALGNPEGKVVTIEKEVGFKDTFYKFCHNENICNIEAIIGESLTMVDKFENNSVDLLFIDGDHQYKSAKGDYNKYFPKVKENGIILIDDIQQNEDMRKFWEEIQEPKFDVNFIRAPNSIRPEEGVGFGVVLKGNIDGS